MIGHPVVALSQMAFCELKENYVNYTAQFNWYTQVLGTVTHSKWLVAWHQSILKWLLAHGEAVLNRFTLLLMLQLYLEVLDGGMENATIRRATARSILLSQSSVRAQ